MLCARRALECTEKPTFEKRCHTMTSALTKTKPLLLTKTKPLLNSKGKPDRKVADGMGW
jgi:hypothetical protein